MDCTYCYCPIYEVKGCQDKSRGKKLKNGLKDCTDCLVIHNPAFVAHVAYENEQFKKAFNQKASTYQHIMKTQNKQYPPDNN